MSGNKLIDDYLSDLMDDAAPAPEPASATPAEAPAEPRQDEHDERAADAADDEEPAATSADDDVESNVIADGGTRVADDGTQTAAVDDPAADAATEPLAADDADDNARVDDAGTDAHANDAPAPSPADRAVAAPSGDPLAAFRDGGRDIGEDEFEAMLDVLQGKAPPPVAAPAAAADVGEPGDPLAAFREGGHDISDDEFEAMLDVLDGKAPPPAVVAPSPPVEAAVPAPPPPPRSVPRPVRPAPMQELLPAVAEMLAPEPGSTSAPVMSPEPRRERHRRADERISAWLRFNIGRQHFAVEVLKVQEVLRLPMIMPVRGTERAMLGVMNLRGQIVPILDLAIRLGFPTAEPTEASRVIVLEENGETLGLLVASVADVTNVSEAKIERISGTPSLVAADVVRGIARREGNIIIMLDASRLLA